MSVGSNIKCGDYSRAVFDRGNAVAALQFYCVVAETTNPTVMLTSENV